jgi:hypothetical protein
MRSELTLRVPTGLGVRREGLGEEREEGDGVHLEGTADEIEWKAWEMDVESWRGIGRGGLLSFSVERVPSEPLSASRNCSSRSVKWGILLSLPAVREPNGSWIRGHPRVQVKSTRLPLRPPPGSPDRSSAPP